MKRILLTLALIVIALMVAIWRAPASVITGLLPPDFSRIAQVHETTGTLWRGGALVTVTGVPPSLSLAWQCRPSLAPVGLRCELTESLSALVTLDVFASKLIAERVTASLPLQLAAAGVLTAASPNVVASFAEITATRSSLAIKGNLRASDASYRFGTADASLGELTLECAPLTDGQSTLCALSNRGGNARLDGKLSLTPGKASGTVELTPSKGPAQRVSF